MRKDSCLTMTERDDRGRVEITGEGNIVGDDSTVEIIHYYQPDEELRQELSEVRARLVDALAELGRTNAFLRDLALEVRDLSWRVRALEAAIGQPAPVDLLREATRLVAERVAPLLDGKPWKDLKQRILTQASKIPLEAHVDLVALEAAADDLARLNAEIKSLLEAYGYTEDPSTLEALTRRASALARYLQQIMALTPEAAPELTRLADGVEVDEEVVR